MLEKGLLHMHGKVFWANVILQTMLLCMYKQSVPGHFRDLGTRIAKALVCLKSDLRLSIPSESYWVAYADLSVCIGDGAVIVGCSFLFSFCHPLPPFVHETCADSSVCQIVTYLGGYTDVYSMGAFLNYTMFRESEFTL